MIRREGKYTNDWGINPRFGIKLHKKDKNLLESIKTGLGDVGSIVDNTDKAVQYRVGSKKDLKLIIEHFDKHPLITQKFADYQLFKQAFELILSKEHLTDNGLKKLVAIKASMNKGLPETLKNYFPNMFPVTRPIVTNQEITANWLSGFTSAEGSFMIYVTESNECKIGYSSYLKFTITQHTRDKALLEKIVKYLDCGRVEKHDENSYVFIVSKFSDINEKVIPFFNKYPIIGIKSEDFKYFCKAAELISNKKHLVSEGLDKIKELKTRMNKGRLAINTEVNSGVKAWTSYYSYSTISKPQMHDVIGIKALDFVDFCKAAEIVKTKKHLRLEGLNRIKELKSIMIKGKVAINTEISSNINPSLLSNKKGYHTFARKTKS
uniref:Ribosomal protein S3 n=1 Tax=Dactylellina haptotyla TaxID=430498 RepID=A0A481ZJ32_9PEZI|nr:ribosomal protein S3 [Dactylellina haptotyla]QBL01970.1 ribosomal protein S3 [Dactylellina haptotyla]